MREKVGVPVNIVKMRKSTVNSILGNLEQKVRLRRPYNLHTLERRFSPTTDVICLDNLRIARFGALGAERRRAVGEARSEMLFWTSPVVHPRREVVVDRQDMPGRPGR